MVLVKVQKNKAYFKRYQVKYRRRREGKTDYHARRRLVTQEKNKYNSPKYRLVVRKTNKKILAQIVYSTIQGDKVMCSADSQELPRYGVKLGLTNYAAAYCVGLLIARRLLKQVNLADQYKGVAEVTGEDYHVEEEMSDGARPFKAVLDIGLTRTTTGNRVFGVLKGAVDGGLHVPHSNRRMPGFTAEEDGKGGSYDAEAHQARILGTHVSKYMQELKDEDPERYTKLFGQFEKAKINPADLEKIYTKAHAAIRANPDREQKKGGARSSQQTREGDFIKTQKGSYARPKPLTKEQRQARVDEKMQLLREKALAKAEGAGDEE